MTKLSVLLRWMSLCLLATGMAGCASDEVYSSLPREPGRSVTLDSGQKPLQCVPYARDHSQVKIYGDAWTWWDQAAGKFPRGSAPAPGAVMVLSGYAGAQRGHVAVVKKIVSPREIRVDHANWLDDGSIYLNDPVEDVSAGNDWTEVKVYNIKTGGWGVNTYPVQGFIGSGSDSPPAVKDQYPDGSLIDARTAPKPTAPPRVKPKPAPPADPDQSPSLDAPPDEGDPLPNPDMVVSANIPQGQE